MSGAGLAVLDLSPWSRFVAARFPETYTLKNTARGLIYDYRAAPCITERWPQAVITDATDIVHDSRFEVVINDCDPDEFMAVLILEGWAETCLEFALALRMPECGDDVRRWLDRAKTMKEAGYVARP